MHRAVIILFMLLCGCVATIPTPANLDLSTLPASGQNSGWNHEGPIPASVFTRNLGGFIPVAMSLQAMGRKAGSQALLDAARTADFHDYEKVVVLCRMLFEFRDGVDYVYPSLGQRTFFWDTTFADWPLEPVELVDGYPFWIVSSLAYSGARSPDAASRYVSYCITNCEWNAFKYHLLSTEQKRAALGKLLESKKWKRPLDERDRLVLSSQIE